MESGGYISYVAKEEDEEVMFGFLFIMKFCLQLHAAFIKTTDAKHEKSNYK
jgi:hypothetical protein